MYIGHNCVGGGKKKQALTINFRTWEFTTRKRDNVEESLRVLQADVLFLNDHLVHEFLIVLRRL